MAQQTSNFSGGGGGGTTEESSTADDAPEGAKRAVEQTPDGKAITDAFDELNNSDGGSKETDAPTGSQRAVEQTPDEDVRDTSPERGAERAVEDTPEPETDRSSSSNTTDTGARGAVEQTPDEQVDRNASVEARQERNKSDSTGVRDTATRVNEQTQNNTQSQSLTEQISQTIDDARNQASEGINQATQTTTQDLGDTPVTNPVTGNRFEEDLNRTRDSIGESISGFRDFNRTIFQAGVTNRLYGTDSRNDTSTESFGRDLTTQGLTGVTTGTAGVIQAPFDTAAAAKEVAETGVFAVSGDGTLSERGQRIAEQGGRFLGVTAQSAANRPFEFAAGAVVETAVGGVAGSRFRAAGRSGARAARRASSEGASSVRSRTPTIDVGFNPDAPTFDVTPGAFEAVRRTRDTSTAPDPTLSRTQGAIQSSLANADLALQGAARRIGEVTRNPGRTADRALDRVVDTVVTDPDTQTRTIDVRGPRERISGVLPETPDTNLPNPTQTVRNRVRATADSATRARDRAQGDARNLAADIGIAIEQVRTRAVETPQNVRDAVARRRAARESRSGDLQTDIRYSIEETTARARDVPGQVSDALYRRRRRAEFALDDAASGLRGSAFVARERALDAAESVGDFELNRPGTPDINLPDISSGDGPRLRDLSVRIGPSRPSRQSQQVLDVTGLDDVEADVRGDLETPDGETGGGGGDAGQVGSADAFNIDGPDAGGQLDTTRTGTGTDQVVLEVGDTRTRNPDTGTQGAGFDLGSGLGSGLFDGAAPSGDLPDTTSGDLSDTGRGEGDVQGPQGGGGLDFDIGPVGLPDFDLGQPEVTITPPRQKQPPRERQPPREKQPPRQRQPPRFDIDQPPQIDLETPEQPDQRTPRKPDVPSTPRRPRADLEIEGQDNNRRRREELFGGDEQRFVFETRDIL